MKIIFIILQYCSVWEYKELRAMVRLLKCIAPTERDLAALVTKVNLMDIYFITEFQSMGPPQVLILSMQDIVVAHQEGQESEEEDEEEGQR